MKKTLIVGKWEYIEKVKTKTFLISLFLTPAIIILFAVLPTLLANQIETTTKAIGIIDTSGIYFRELREKVSQYKLEDNQPNYVLVNLAGANKNIGEIKNSSDELVLLGKLEGYLLILNGGTDSLKAEFCDKNTANFRDIDNFTNALNNVRADLILTKEGVSPSIIKSISDKIKINPIKIEKGNTESKSDFLVIFFSSFVFIILLMMMILSSGGMLIRSLVEEKSNRLIEILISSCTPDELLMGKVFGLSSLGLTQVIIWSLVGISLAGAGVIPIEVFNNLVPIFIYFLFGFVFYSAIFVGIGSIVTSEQEAQQITSYLSLVLVLPVALTLPAIENPDSLLVHILSLVPFTAPSIMILRFNIGPIPGWEVILSAVIMIISIYFVVFVSAKIFRIGILSYGKKPSLREIINWLKSE